MGQCILMFKFCRVSFFEEDYARVCGSFLWELGPLRASVRTLHPPRPSFALVKVDVHAMGLRAEVVETFEGLKHECNRVIVHEVVKAHA